MVASPILHPPPLVEIKTERARRHLYEFVKQAWHVVEPNTPFIGNWHIEAICLHLEALVRTVTGQTRDDDPKIRNLLINMPPRMMKSLTVSVFFPAWAWIDHPHLRFLYASYSQDLATDHSVATRRVIESDWYQERWGDRFQLAGDANLKTKFDNDHRGSRQSTSVGGTGTGKGGDIVVVDDPHNVKEAESDTIRQAALDWWDKTMSTRLNDAKRGGRVIVMQRVHEDDLSGHVIEQGGYEHLCLPMEYVPTDHTTVIGWSDPRTELGELLAPERFGEAEVIEAKRRMGSLAYAGQMQQEPAPADGEMFKRDWWRRYRSLPVDVDNTTQLVRVELVLDSAFKDGVANDFSVYALWGATAAGSAYLIRVWRHKLQFPALIQLGHDAHAWARQAFPTIAIPMVIEDKASGQSAIQVFRSPYHTEHGVLPALPVVPHPVPANLSKTARAEGITPFVEGGRTLIPDDAEWLDDWLAEHQKFPNGAHDDQVDTTAIALSRLLLSPSVPSLAPSVASQRSTWS